MLPREWKDNGDWKEMFANHIYDKKKSYIQNKKLSKLNNKKKNNNKKLAHTIRKWQKIVTLHHKNIKMTNKHMKRCLTSLDVNEIQIKATLKYYHISIRIVKIEI